MNAMRFRSPNFTLAASAAIFFSLSLGVFAASASDPVPLITQPLVPDAVAPGGPGFTLTVNGSGFLSTSVVQWNGVALVTQFVSASRLTATVPASNVGTPGTASVTVYSSVPGGTSNVLYLPVTASVPSLAFSRSNFDFGAAPYGLVADDFNGDRKLDVAATDVATNSVEVLFGNGDGSFQPPASYPTYFNPFWVSAGDFNNDGKLDLAAACDGKVSILLNNGDGTFQPHVDYTVGSGPTLVLVADFNGDGNADLAVVNNGSAPVSILLGNGDGTFQNEVEYSGHRGISGAAVGDFNADGRLDLAAANDTGSISVFLGNGDGTFQNQMFTSVPGTFFSVVTADFNGDGKLDLAAADYEGATVQVLLGNGDGTFQAPLGYSTGQGAIQIAAADLNADGKLDLVTANVFDNTVSILLGNGNGTFKAALAFSAGTEPNTLAVGDFDGNGMLDTVAASLGDDDFALLLQSTAGFSPGSLDFGHQLVGTASNPQTSSFTNSGSSALGITKISVTGTNGTDFNQTNNCGSSLGANASCTFTVTFTPSAFGERSATIDVTDNAPGSPQPLFLSGFGDAPSVELIPTSLVFAPQLVKTFSPVQQVELINSGTETLTIASIAINGQFLLYNPCPSSLTPNANCFLTVTFKPASVGAKTGAITVTDNAAGSPQTVSLSGSGTFFELSPAALKFGNVAIGQTASQNVTVTNASNTTQTIAGIHLGENRAGEFSQTNNCGTSLGAKASCTIAVTFAPTKLGSSVATLQVSGGGANQVVPISGAGIN